MVTDTAGLFRYVMWIVILTCAFNKPGEIISHARGLLRFVIYGSYGRGWRRIRVPSVDMCNTQGYSTYWYTKLTKNSHILPSNARSRCLLWLFDLMRSAYDETTVKVPSWLRTYSSDSSLVFSQRNLMTTIAVIFVTFHEWFSIANWKQCHINSKQRWKNNFR